MSNNVWRANIRDPLADRMLGAGGTHTLETQIVAGHPQQVFSGAPRNLAGLYGQAMQHGDRIMVVQDGRIALKDAAFLWVFDMFIQFDYSRSRWRLSACFY